MIDVKIQYGFRRTENLRSHYFGKLYGCDVCDNRCVYVGDMKYYTIKAN